MKSAHRAEADSAQRGSSTIAAFFAAIIALLAATFGLQHAPVATTSQPAAAAQSTTQQFQDLSSQASPSPASSSEQQQQSAAPTEVAQPTIITVGGQGSALASELAQLRFLGTQLQYDVASLPTDNPASTSYLTVPAWAPSQAIDQLSGTTLTDVSVAGISGLTASEIPALDYFPATSTISVFYGGTGTSTAPSANKLLVSDANGNWEYVATSSLGISGGASPWTTAGSNIYFGSGKVGIGTTSPSYPLDVAGYINTDQYSGYKQGGSNILVASSSLNDAFVATLTAFPPIDTTGHNAIDPSECSGRYGEFNTGVGILAASALTAACEDTAVGYDALTSATSSMGDTAVGTFALQDDTFGLANTAIGYEAEQDNTSGTFNTAIGGGALGFDTNPSGDTAVGQHSMENAVNSSADTALGENALGTDNLPDSTPTNDTAIGLDALMNTTANSDNSVLGYNAGYWDTTGNNNTGMGFEALQDNTTGINNTALGYAALNGNNTSAAYTDELGVGYEAGFHDETGVNNITIGTQAGFDGIAGTANIYIGADAGFIASSSTSENTFVGYEAGEYASSTSNTGGDTFVGGGSGGGTASIYNTGLNNTAVGYESLLKGTSGNSNTAIGQLALSSGASGSFFDETALGVEAGQDDVGGSNNVYLGFATGLIASSSQKDNTFVGSQAGEFASSTSNNASNTLLGFAAGAGASSAYDTGTGNTYVGYLAGQLTTSGAENTILGSMPSEQSDVTTGSQNIVIGYNVGLPSSVGSGQLDIANAIYGTGLTGTGSNISSGYIGIGTTSPYSTLEVWGPNSAASTSAFAVVNSASTTVFAAYDNGNATYSGSIFQSSDQRLKTGIATLDASSSLSAIESLNPVSYLRLDQPGTGENLGFIAQQVQQIFPQLVSTSTPTALTPDGTLTLNYTGLIAPIVGAIQDVALISGDFETNLIAWLGNASNGIGDLFAQNIYATNITATDISSQQDTTQQLCVGAGPNDPSPVCITKSQLAAILAAAGTPNSPESVTSSAPDNGTGNSPISVTSSPGDANPESVTSSTDTQPIIQINGDNPATVQVGATYTDLGATITGPQQDLNVGIEVIVDGGATTTPDQIQIDTSAPATDTVEYVATDQNGFEGTATRTVIVSAPAQSDVAASSTTQ